LYEGNDDENLQSEWEILLGMFDPSDEGVGSSDNKGRANLRNDIEIDLKTMREKTIAYHQLKDFSLYLKDKPNLTAAYRKFLVSCVYFLWCLHVLHMIIPHTNLILQLRYSREATANRAPGQPLVFTAPGRFESAPVGYFNVEVAAIAGRGRGDNDDDNDDDDNDNDDNDDNDDDDNDDGNQKPSDGGIILVPRAERRRDHRGMASVTTTIGNRKRKATGGPAV
jgi:hypothetical protein